MSRGKPERGVWSPHRTPSAPEVRAWAPARARAALGALVERPSEAVRHIAAAARAGQRAVVQAPLVQSAGHGLVLGASMAAAAGRNVEIITSSERLAQLAEELGVPVGTQPSSNTDAWFVHAPHGGDAEWLWHADTGGRLVVAATDAWHGGQALAETLAIDAPCAWIDTVPWHRLRTRILAPLRRSVKADAHSLEQALEVERARAAASREPFEPCATVGVEAWARALGQSEAERPAGVLWASDAPGCLRGLLVARCIREGRMLAPTDEPSALGEMAEAEVDAVREALERSEERAVYGLLSRLRANRSAATSIVMWVAGGGAWSDGETGTSA